MLLRLTPTRPIALTIVCGLLLSRALHAADVLVPVVTRVNVLYSTCETWTADVTLTVTPVDESEPYLQPSAGSYYSPFGHKHYGTTSGSTPWFVTDDAPQMLYVETPSGRAEAMRRIAFGRGAVAGESVVARVKHAGSCAGDYDESECATGAVHPGRDKNHPFSNVTPVGSCIVVPPPVRACTFDSPSATIDLGTGGAGARDGSVVVYVTCDSAASISVHRGGGDPLTIDGEPVSLTANNKTLPASFNFPAGRQPLAVTATASLPRPGSFSVSDTIVIDVR